MDQNRDFLENTRYTTFSSMKRAGIFGRLLKRRKIENRLYWSDALHCWVVSYSGKEFRMGFLPILREV